MELISLAILLNDIKKTFGKHADCNDALLNKAIF